MRVGGCTLLQARWSAVLLLMSSKVRSALAWCSRISVGQTNTEMNTQVLQWIRNGNHLQKLPIAAYNAPTWEVCPLSAATMSGECPAWSTAFTSDPWTRTSCSPATLSAWAAACSGVLCTGEVKGYGHRLGAFQHMSSTGALLKLFNMPQMLTFVFAWHMKTSQKHTHTRMHAHTHNLPTHPPSFSVPKVNQLCSQGFHQQFSSTIMAIDSDENRQTRSRTITGTMQYTRVKCYLGYCRGNGGCTHRAQCKGLKGLPSWILNGLCSSKTSKQSSCPKHR